jgi:hypothetical protein
MYTGQLRSFDCASRKPANRQLIGFMPFEDPFKNGPLDKKWNNKPRIETFTSLLQLCYKGMNIV